MNNWCHLKKYMFQDLSLITGGVVLSLAVSGQFWVSGHIPLCYKFTVSVFCMKIYHRQYVLKATRDKNSALSTWTKISWAYDTIWDRVDGMNCLCSVYTQTLLITTVAIVCKAVSVTASVHSYLHYEIQIIVTISLLFVYMWLYVLYTI